MKTFLREFQHAGWQNYTLLVIFLSAAGAMLNACDSDLWRADTPAVSTTIVNSTTMKSCLDEMENNCTGQLHDKQEEPHGLVSNRKDEMNVQADIGLQEAATGEYDSSPDMLNTNTDTVSAGVENSNEISLKQLSRQALYDDDENKRVDAINTLALYRTEETTETLLQASADPEPSIRYQAIQTLRLVMADGLDRDGRIAVVLQQATLDDAPRVARLAAEIQDELEKATGGIEIIDH